MIKNLFRDVEAVRNRQKSLTYARFFKTGDGEYGEGDIFYGLSVPECRKIAHTYKSLSLEEISQLLHSPIHEVRLIGLLILVKQYGTSDNVKQKEIAHFYLKHTVQINNWDLVDLSCYHILGAFCFDNQKEDILYKLALSHLLWDRRISVISTYAYIKRNTFVPTLKIAKMLLYDKHDLIHKAVGWMLREVGKKDMNTLRDFLDTWALQMPRTMLRYATEKMEAKERKQYLKTKMLKLKTAINK